MDHDYQNTAQTHSTNSDIKNYGHMINLQLVGCARVCVCVCEAFISDEAKA